MLYNNPYDGNGFQIQICCLIISPAFVSAGIYLTLKHIVITFGDGWSRLRPAWYTYIFIAGDLFSLVLQGAGGGIAATADNGSTLQDVGTNLMVSGSTGYMYSIQTDDTCYSDCRCHLPSCNPISLWLFARGIHPAHPPSSRPDQPRSQRTSSQDILPLLHLRHNRCILWHHHSMHLSCS